MGSKSRLKYVNPHIAKIRRSLLDVFLWKTGYYNDHSHIEKPPSSFSYPTPTKPLLEDEPTVTWVNHSTFLIQIEGVHILTDPIWSDRCSPLKKLGPKRHHPPPFRISELPRIDYVFISHNHYDHLDKDSVLKLFKRFPEITWIVPMGVKAWFLKKGISKILELSWWEEFSIASKSHPHLNLKVTAVPSQHFSGRRGYDLNQTLWVGWVVECERQKKPLKRFYFVGDTGYNHYDFKKIGEKWGSMDLSLIPIGSYSPRKFMSPVHIDPQSAVQIHQEVGSQLSIGMHWKTFRLSDESPHQPPYDLFVSLQKRGIDPLSFLVLEPGHAINW